MAEGTPLLTIWEVPDDLWQRIDMLIEQYDPPKPTGRKREDARKILNGIIYRFRSGSQWNHLPKQYGDDSTIHRTFQRWVEISLFEMLWSLLAAECDELGRIDWRWQAADGWLGKARSGGDQIGPNPTDRAKNGTKKSLLTDAGGGPLSIVIAPANVNDHKLLGETIESIVVERPAPRSKRGKTSASTKATITEPVGRFSKSTATEITSAGSAKRSWIRRARSNTLRAATSLKERLLGYPSAEAC